ncbi:MAG TPA: hypothetical protein VFS44_00375 [Gemmatimonadaceae bacterium]|nr:hypothetical protein [Gemmatimonadaceae bacterium]
MSPRSTPPCPHEQRPGTKVCLHCRREARLAARARRRRSLVRYGLAGVTIAILGAAGIAGATALQRRPPRALPSRSAATPVTGPDASLHPNSDGSATTAPAAIAGGPATTASRGARPAPVVAEGRTALRDGMFAVRAGDTVTVHFDTPLARTRRPLKFERIVRTTLPMVFGAAADSALSPLRDGAIAEAGELLSELPSRGVRLPTVGGWTLALYPETRPGEDGPLVISYRVAVTR